MRLILVCLALLYGPRTMAESRFAGFEIDLKDVPAKVVKTAIDQDPSCKKPLNAGKPQGTRVYVIDCGKLQHCITEDGIYFGLYTPTPMPDKTAAAVPLGNKTTKQKWPCGSGLGFADELAARKKATSGDGAWADQAQAFRCLSKNQIFSEDLKKAALKALAMTNPHGDLLRNYALRYLVEANADPKQMRAIITNLSTHNEISTDRESCDLMGVLSCFDCESRLVLKSWMNSPKRSISTPAKANYDRIKTVCQSGRKWSFARQPIKCDS